MKMTAHLKTTAHLKMTAYLTMTAYLRVAHIFEIDRGFETPIAPHREAPWRVFTGTGLGLVDVGNVVHGSCNIWVLVTMNFLADNQSLLEQLNRFLQFSLPRSNTDAQNRWVVKLQYAVKITSSTPGRD